MAHRQRIYVDTAVIGGCFDDEFSTWSLGLMKDFRLGHYRAVLSEVVAAEVAEAPVVVRDRYAEIAALPGSEVLPVTLPALGLADAYLARDIVSHKFEDDALHIALATISQVDVLVSWNFRHIVHFEKIRLFNAVNLELGYKTLQIFSPREVAHHAEK